MPLSKRKIVLSGSSGGIGRCLGARLLDHGALLATISRSPSGLPGGRHFAADLSSEAGRKSAAAFAEDEQPDVLINLAGIQYFGPAEQQSSSDVEATYGVNLIAPVLLSQAVLPAMKRKRSGQIVNIGLSWGQLVLPISRPILVQKPASGCSAKRCGGNWPTRASSSPTSHPAPREPV